MGRVALACWLTSCVALAGCASTPPEGAARVEIALPEQSANLRGDPVASANLHADEQVTINLLRTSSPVAMHRHLESEEIVYVLSGEGILHLQSGDRALAAGDLVIVPRNTPHGFDPTGPHPAVILQIFVPRFVEGDRVFEAARR